MTRVDFRSNFNGVEQQEGGGRAFSFALVSIPRPSRRDKKDPAKSTLTKLLLQNHLSPEIRVVGFDSSGSSQISSCVAPLTIHAMSTASASASASASSVSNLRTPSAVHGNGMAMGNSDPRPRFDLLGVRCKIDYIVGAWVLRDGAHMFAVPPWMSRAVSREAAEAVSDMLLGGCLAARGRVRDVAAEDGREAEASRMLDELIGAPGEKFPDAIRPYVDAMFSMTHR